MPRERIAILAHCYAGWAYAWASPYDPGKEVEEKGVVYTTIAHPHGLERLTQLIFLATAVVLLTQYASPSYALALLEHGCAGRAYLLKDRVVAADDHGTAFPSQKRGKIAAWHG